MKALFNDWQALVRGEWSQVIKLLDSLYPFAQDIRRLKTYLRINNEIPLQRSGSIAHDVNRLAQAAREMVREHARIGERWGAISRELEGVHAGKDETGSGNILKTRTSR